MSFGLANQFSSNQLEAPFNHLLMMFQATHNHTFIHPHVARSFNDVPFCSDIALNLAVSLTHSVNSLAHVFNNHFHFNNHNLGHGVGATVCAMSHTHFHILNAPLSWLTHTLFSSSSVCSFTHGFALIYSLKLHHFAFLPVTFSIHLISASTGLSSNQEAHRFSHTCCVAVDDLYSQPVTSLTHWFIFFAVLETISIVSLVGL